MAHTLYKKGRYTSCLYIQVAKPVKLPEIYAPFAQKRLTRTVYCFGELDSYFGLVERSTQQEVGVNEFNYYYCCCITALSRGVFSAPAATEVKRLCTSSSGKLSAGSLSAHMLLKYMRIFEIHKFSWYNTKDKYHVTPHHFSKIIEAVSEGKVWWSVKLATSTPLVIQCGIAFISVNCYQLSESITCTFTLRVRFIHNNVTFKFNKST